MKSVSGINGWSVDCRSREGARIEILCTNLANLRTTVAPVRERGLKFLLAAFDATALHSRSREGARIEISAIKMRIVLIHRRSREGARIEISMLRSENTIKQRRSREGARIEIPV